MKNLLNFFRNEPKVMPEAKIEDRPPKPIHTHEWDLISKTYAPPVKNITLNQNGVEKDIMEKTLFGVTVILWQCLVCKDLRKEEMLGSDENTLDELIVKSEEYGPQFIEREGKIYVVAKYQVPVAAPASIPIR